MSFLYIFNTAPGTWCQSGSQESWSVISALIPAHCMASDRSLQPGFSLPRVNHTKKGTGTECLWRIWNFLEREGIDNKADFKAEHPMEKGQNNFKFIHSLIQSTFELVFQGTVLRSKDRTMNMTAFLWESPDLEYDMSSRSIRSTTWTVSVSMQNFFFKNDLNNKDNVLFYVPGRPGVRQHSG